MTATERECDRDREKKQTEIETLICIQWSLCDGSVVGKMGLKFSVCLSNLPEFTFGPNLCHV